MGGFARIAAILVAPLLLFGCLLTPGKFVSTMTINADRTFAFTYKGEVIALDPSSAMKGFGDKPGTDDDATPPAKGTSSDGDDQPALRPIAATTTKDAPEEDAETKNRAIAASLSKEYGYRSVVYQGKGKFLIDYAITGTLTHNFTYPFNSDAEAIFPFVVIELRQGGLVRVKAPGFASNANSNGAGGMGAMSGSDQASKSLDGVFTLDTNAEIVSQNNEEGAKIIAGRKTIVWKATPLTKDAPSAVLKLAR
ncbi:hypothetical protein D3Y57_12845 [Sphingomonas paeninsulae]|uniref:Uncharacterized protein n=2 Tax=Sphingomonas paeninsulae TaxID=2319844 RepID=A0A494TLS9_SPHPE|nr:hypothetical protein D3Y57_12845 [Sphingomonas paeninsulae]